MFLRVFLTEKLQTNTNTFPAIYSEIPRAPPEAQTIVITNGDNSPIHLLRHTFCMVLQTIVKTYWKRSSAYGAVAAGCNMLYIHKTNNKARSSRSYIVVSSLFYISRVIISWITKTKQHYYLHVKLITDIILKLTRAKYHTIIVRK